MNLLILFAEFFRIGLFSVGGGLAALPFLYRLAETAEWLQAEQIPEMLAAAQSAPGAIGINLAVYAGFQCAGIPGGVCAALGMASPSIIVILIIARALQTFRENAVIQAIFSGLRPAAAGLLAAAALAAIKLSLYNPEWTAWHQILRPRETVLFALTFLLLRRYKGHPVIYIAAGGVIGAVLGL